MEKPKTASDIVIEAIDEFCNNYCKHQEEFSKGNKNDKHYDELIEKCCNDCPLNRIY